MGGKRVNEGKIDVGTWYLKNNQASRGADALYVGLYTDTTEPLATATLASGITELALTGYARIQLLDADWSNVIGLFTNLQKTFTAGEEWGNVYGYFICNVSTGTAGELIAVEHFSNGPYFIQNGKTVKITPTIDFTA